MGDLNCDISKHPPPFALLDLNMHKLLFLSSLYNFDQLNKEQTSSSTVTRTSATMIDLFFTNIPENILQS